MGEKVQILCTYNVRTLYCMYIIFDLFIRIRTGNTLLAGPEEKN